MLHVLPKSNLDSTFGSDSILKNSRFPSIVYCIVREASTAHRPYEHYSPRHTRPVSETKARNGRHRRNGRHQPGNLGAESHGLLNQEPHIGPLKKHRLGIHC